MECEKRSCIDCALAGCGESGGKGKHPQFCESVEVSADERAEMIDAYQGEDLKIMQAATQTCSRTGRDGLCRVEETMDFAARMGYHKIGIANCGALQREALAAAKIFRLHGFEVFGASCKFASLTYDDFGCNEKLGVNPNSIACNPIIQARRLNEWGSELNVILGLCVGHDTLFMKHAEAPCTYLVVKDRILANNPGAALNCCDQPAYAWNRLMREGDPLGQNN